MNAVLRSCAVLIMLISLATDCKSQRIDTVRYDGAFLAPVTDVATKYSYDLPLTILDHQQQLGLTADQIAKLKKIEATLELKRTETRISAKRNEHMLDSMFRTGKMNEGSIIFYTNRYGLYEGEYRGAVLLACYETRLVLTRQQLSKLISLKNHN